MSNTVSFHGLDAAENYVGTCQACFGSYAVNGKDTTVYLHGYKRPGYGHTEGRCPGEGAAPFEISKALTEAIRDRTVAQVKHLTQLLGELKAGPAELLVEVPDLDKPARIEGFRRIQPTKHVTIRPGDETEAERWNGKVIRTTSFKQHLDAKVGRIAAALSEEEFTLNFLNKKLVSWKYCPESMPTKAKADLEVARAQRATLGARKAERQAKKDEAAERAAARLATATDRIMAYLGQAAFIEYLAATGPYGRHANYLDMVWSGIEYHQQEVTRYPSSAVSRTQGLAADLKRYAKDARAAGYKVKG